MSDNIPFEIQAEILKKLPIKSLIQFRSVSKPWKSLIDSPKFINDHTANHNQPHHLLVSFPKHKVSVTAPRTVRLLSHALKLGSSNNGLLCLYGVYRDLGYETEMMVLWNPSIRKSVGIPLPDMLYMPGGYTAVGFGVCPGTNDPKIVKVTHVNISASSSEFGSVNRLSNHIPWEVEVFTLSSCLWRSVRVDTSRKPIALTLNQAVVDGVIYWHAFDNIDMDVGSCNLIVSFDLASEEFREVCIPDSFVRSENLSVCKLSDESLGVLDLFEEVEVPFCVVWMMERGGRNVFKKLFSVKAPNNSEYFRVVEFRRNGEAIMETKDDDEVSAALEVYDPCSQRINDLGIRGNEGSLSVCSYTETLLLLDKTDSIIR